MALLECRSFHQGIRIRTNLIDVYEHGHWKVNFRASNGLKRKGLRRRLSHVDMVALQDNYDVARCHAFWRRPTTFRQFVI